MTENYDEAYHTDGYFGDRPHPSLEVFAHRLADGARVLDLGVGQGRHALPLARRGCRVTGLDLSAEAVAQVNAAAGQEGLPCTAVLEDVFGHEPDEPYDGVLCFGLFQMLPSERVMPLAELLQGWVKPGGTLWITAWHTDDPGFGDPADPWCKVGPRAWHDAGAGRHRFWFHPEEVLDLFPGWQVLHHDEDLGPVHSHGDGPPEQHGDVVAVLGRPTKPLVDAWTRLSGT